VFLNSFNSCDHLNFEGPFFFLGMPVTLKVLNEAAAPVGKITGLGSSAIASAEGATITNEGTSSFEDQPTRQERKQPMKVSDLLLLLLPLRMHHHPQPLPSNKPNWHMQ
jgi:hypothetical protein